MLLTEDCREIAAIIDGDRAVFGDTDFEFASGWGACLAPLCGQEPPEAGGPARRERSVLPSAGSLRLGCGVRRPGGLPGEAGYRAGAPARITAKIGWVTI